MANRITKWILYTILFAFIPIAISLVLSYLSNSNNNIFEFSNEVLFFSIMISSTSLNDVVELNRKLKDYVLTIFNAFFILLAIASAVLYGSLTYGQINNITPYLFKEKVFIIAVILAIVGGILGTIIQILLSRIERQA